MAVSDQRVTTEVDGLPLALSNLTKPLFPSGFTKGELIAYYAEVADALLPHLRDRAVTRVRFPNGTGEESFYEKNVPAGAPDWVTTVNVATSAGTVNYVTATRRADLVWLANLKAVELHTPQWRIPDATMTDAGLSLSGDDEPRSTTLVVDLDPGPGITPADSARGAILAATALADLGLEAFPKTSGNKGLQVFAPIEPTAWQLVVEQARAFAQRLASQYPETFVAVMAKERRAERIFVDYLQNQAARNTIAPYSLRARPFESVSTPLSWDEVAAVGERDTLSFTAGQVLQRVEEHGDLWHELLDPACAAPLPTLG